MNKNTIVVNLMAGPGAGKSTTMAAVFAKMKMAGIDCEMATEFAKDLTWEGRTRVLQNQIYVFAKQHQRITKLIGQVDVVITDSPIILSSYYNIVNNGNPLLKDLIYSEFMKCNNLNFFIDRVKGYNPNGRNQTEEEAIKFSNEIDLMLKELKIDCTHVPGNEQGVDIIFKAIMNLVGKKYNRKIILENDNFLKLAANNLPDGWIWVINKEDGSGALRSPDLKKSYFAFDSQTREYVNGECSNSVKRNWVYMQEFNLEEIMDSAEAYLNSPA